MYHQQQPADPNAGAIAVTTRYHWMTFIIGLFQPFVAINGHRVQAGWGRTVIPMPAGQHHVHVHVPYLLPPRIGPADSMVPVYPGQVVEVEYRVPVIAWLGGTIGPPPQRHRGMVAGVALMTVPIALLLCVLGLLGVVNVVDRDTDRPAAAPPVSTTDPATVPPSTAAEPSAVPSSAASPAAPAAGKPTLRPTPARTLVGPSYSTRDRTYTMAIPGVPFAFRVPSTWGCLKGKIDVPGATAWVCVDEGDPFDASAPEPDRGKRMQFMLRPCPGTCDNADVVTLSRDWFDDGAKAKFVDDRTAYVETARNADGRYTLDMSHFITVADGSKWQVAVGVHSQPESKSLVQKLVNDMLTQAG
ncbi:hypothetical protein [Actinoplanes derwentensis]|uniref:Uncharacterized protein n=1 Tax=Actinoplanes derwentensis TaxID=113562 RepID=A0A1H1Y267_9ACTN|nr:hypothetical protein [Actinoplanes derwentensis]GID86751.1 hypothetical protein Ade03nite_56750 [Actinoplanes derwentensis]SDT15522.1 hypothetical protein SAMN04489716_2678 [Actinoplanes derwentensis]